MPKRITLPFLVDIFVIDDATEIVALGQHPDLDRNYAPIGPLLNRLLAIRIMRTFQTVSGTLPTMRGRFDMGRDEIQQLLAERSSDPSLRNEPWYRQRLGDLADYVAGQLEHDDMGQAAQEIFGRLIKSDYRATASTWQAAIRFDRSARSTNPFSWAMDWISGEARKSRTVLSEAIDGDLAGVHATGIAVHNLVATLDKMKSFLGSLGQPDSVSSAEVLAACLQAPATLLRQVKTPFLLTPQARLDRGTLVLFKLNEAFVRSGQVPLAFMEKSWTRCPADRFTTQLVLDVWSQSLRLCRQAQ